jgi:hypothetical protein
MATQQAKDTRALKDLKQSARIAIAALDALTLDYERQRDDNQAKMLRARGAQLRLKAALDNVEVAG